MKAKKMSEHDVYKNLVNAVNRKKDSVSISPVEISKKGIIRKGIIELTMPVQSCVKKTEVTSNLKKWQIVQVRKDNRVESINKKYV